MVAARTARLIDTVLAAGKRASAREALRKIGALLRQGDREPGCDLAAGLLLLARTGHLDRALELAPAPGPDSPRCLHVTAVKLAEASGDDKALDEAARKALAAFPGDKDLLYLWGMHYYTKSDFDRAVPIWKELVDRDPYYPAVLGQYGTAMLASQRLKKDGIQAQLKKLKQEPGDPAASFLAGMGLYYQHEYAKAVPLLEAAASKLPHESRAHLYLGMSHYFLGHREKAERIFDYLEPYAYHDPDIYYCRSLIYRKRDLKRAIREMQKFVDVFLGEKRLSFGPEKVKKALSDLERMKRGEVPELNLPGHPLQPAM